MASAAQKKVEKNVEKKPEEKKEMTLEDRMKEFAKKRGGYKSPFDDPSGNSPPKGSDDDLFATPEGEKENPRPDLERPDPLDPEHFDDAFERLSKWGCLSRLAS